jgi:hypothetical protein
VLWGGGRGNGNFIAPSNRRLSIWLCAGRGSNLHCWRRLKYTALTRLHLVWLSRGLDKPDWLFLDEATSPLDEKLEAEIYCILSEVLPNTTIVSIEHRSMLICTASTAHRSRAGDGPKGSSEGRATFAILGLYLTLLHGSTVWRRGEWRV